MRPPVHVVLPEGVDDPRRPSGGNTYDLRVVQRLAAARVPVRRADVAGAWPRPDDADVERLDDALARVPDGGAVLVDGLVACGAPAAVERHAGRVRAVVLVHLPLGDETGLAADDAAVLTAAEARALHAAAAVVATSGSAAARLERLHGLPCGSVVIASPGVDPAPLSTPSERGTRLACVASVTPRKGHHVLVCALGAVNPALPWTLTCAGPVTRDPDYLASVRDQVGSLPRPAQVRFAGPLAGADLDALYGLTDLLVLPSLAEPFGMVVTEALARAVPVLASDVDGVPEAVGTDPDGVRPGVLVPPGDPSALADALQRWLSDPEHRAELRAAAVRRRGTLAGWDRTAQILRGVLEGHEPSAGQDATQEREGQR